MKVILPKHVEADAEFFADSQAKRGTKSWNDAKYRYCHEMYSLSMVPAESNPATGEMTVLVEKYPEIFETFAGKRKNKEVNQKLLAGLIENLTNMYLELELNLKTRRKDSPYNDFEMPKNATEAQQRKVYDNRYTRMLVRNVAAEILIPFFTMKASDLNVVASEMGFDQVQDINALKSQSFMREFTSGVREQLNHVFGSINIRAVALKNQIMKIAPKKSSAV